VTVSTLVVFLIVALVAFVVIRVFRSWKDTDFGKGKRR
jgi:large-conductance mechanosensitive channel